METKKLEKLKSWISKQDRKTVDELLLECIEELEVSEAISYYPKSEGDAPYWSNTGVRLGEKD